MAALGRLDRRKSADCVKSVVTPSFCTTDAAT
jgi:hypothetical protein